jgi:hypothetical protein
MSRHNRNRHGRRVQFERYDPVLTTSPYWVDGLLLDGELRSQSMRTLLETRAPLSSPEDDLRVVIMRNLILLFRLINFYLAFIDRPEFLAVIPIDMGWSQNECINLINRYKRARMKFTPHGRTIPPTADGLSALLCRLVDNYVEAEAVNGSHCSLQVDWQPRGLFQPASGRLGESCQDRRRNNPRCSANLPAPPPFPDWLPTRVAGRVPARGLRRSRSPQRLRLEHRQQQGGEQQRRFRSRSPIRPVLTAC